MSDHAAVELSPEAIVLLHSHAGGTGIEYTDPWIREKMKI